MSRQDVHLRGHSATAATVTPNGVPVVARLNVPAVSAGSQQAQTLLGIAEQWTTAPSPHGGGIPTWDGYRAYTSGSMNNLANATTYGMSRPTFLAYSESGPNLGGTTPDYATNLAHCKSVLDTFYYNPASSQTHSSRWGIQLYWSNGNENYDKGVLSTVNATTIDQYTNESQKALYDACHYIDPTTGQRRYPDAYAGSNPTTGDERLGNVQAVLHPSARYHDFVMWSMYPYNQGDAGTSIDYNWPSFNEADMSSTTLGYLIRCFYRTKQAEAQARIDRGDPNFRLAIGCGETGTTYDPRDTTMRPYWCVQAMYRGAMKLSGQYDLDMPFLCYYNSTTSGRAHAFGDDPVGTNPTTAQSWSNAQEWCPFTGGTLPAAWAANPKTAWNSYTTGPVV